MWAEKTKKQIPQSTAILARRKKGKTALVQRLFNILYTKNDPQVIPFYFKIEEGNLTQLRFSQSFYETLLSQYFGFKLRDISLIGTTLSLEELALLAKDDEVISKDIYRMQKLLDANNSDLAWKHARQAGHRISSQKNERIIQIIDEFQFLNKYIYRDEACTIPIELAPFYQGTAESKYSPQLITESYIGWLTTIIRKMVSRYNEYFLESFPPDEALDAVYNYSLLLGQPVTDETAPFIANIAENDPYYIARLMMSNYEGKDLARPESILETLQYETTLPKGQIARIWMEYLWDAFDRVNDKNAKAAVLYLAKHGNDEKTVDEIIRDLNLQISPAELQERLYKLERADIIAMGPSFTRYKGLGDKILEIVLRRIYEEEIEKVDQKKVEEDIKKQLESLKGQVSYYKGISSEGHLPLLIIRQILYNITRLHDWKRTPF